MPSQQGKSRFIPPMLLQRVSSLPEGPAWAYEIKLDGYRALGVKANGKVLLRSRNNKDFNGRYPGIVDALGALPDETVIDGEVVALDSSGRPSFNALQNAGSSKLVLVYYVFDLLILAAQPLSKRRDLLRQRILPKLSEQLLLEISQQSSLSGSQSGWVAGQRLRPACRQWCYSLTGEFRANQEFAIHTLSVVID